MTHHSDGLLMQVITMRERLACLKTAVIERSQNASLCRRIIAIELEQLQLELTAKPTSNAEVSSHFRNREAPDSDGKNRKSLAV